jgi:Ca2+-binding RTX toxin-like protein
VDSGLLAAFTTYAANLQYADGVARIAIPDTDAAQSYKLVVGNVDGGTANTRAARLYVDTLVVTEDRYEIKGNIFEESGPFGISDVLPEGASLESIHWGGRNVGLGSGEYSLKQSSGTLTISGNGDYSFALAEGVNPADLDETITYRSGDASATLRLQGQAPDAHDDLALTEHGYSDVRHLSHFAGGLGGWYTAGTVSKSDKASFDSLPDSEALRDFCADPGAVVLLQPKANLAAAARTALFGTTDKGAITEIFHNAGVQGDAFGASATSSTIFGAAISKSFTAVGGEIGVNWSFTGGASNGDNDAAFWLLKDAGGAVLKSGLLHQGTDARSGTLFIPIEASAEEREYTLALAAVQGGTDDLGQASLRLGDIILLDGEYDYRGNLLGGASPDGQMDVTLYDTHLASVSYAGQTLAFDQANQTRVISGEDGVLRIDWNGEYSFKAAAEGGAGLDASFAYTLTGAAEGDVGTVRLTPEAPLAVDIVPDYLADIVDRVSPVEYAQTPEDPNQWTPVIGAPNRPEPMVLSQEYPTEIAPYKDWNYSLYYFQRAVVSDANIGKLVGASDLSYPELLAMAGVQGDPARENGVYAGKFSQTTFSSVGGAIYVDWAVGGLAADGEQYAAPRENDAVLWILRDENDEVIACRRAWQPDRATSGAVNGGSVEVIEVPISEMPKTYTLVFGMADIGTAFHHDLNLLVDVAVSHSGGCEFSGNALSGSAPDGASNMLDAGSRIASVEYHGVTYRIDDEPGYVNITTETGILRIQADGEYGFFAAKFSDGSKTAEDFTYTIIDPEGQSASAVLSLRGDAYRRFGSDYDDVLDLSASADALLVQAGAGDDAVHGGRGGELLYGQDGNDSIFGDGGADRLYGGAGDDLLKGGIGDDTLMGSAGNDILVGGEGADILYGGTGDDVLRGDAGADVFAWKHAALIGGSDRVEDFSLSEGDRLGFTELLDNGQSLEQFLNDKASDLNLNLETDEFTFTLGEGAFATQASIQCDLNDTRYADLKTAYIAADNPADQQELLSQLLTTMAGG